MTPEPLLEAVALTKHYNRGWLRRDSGAPAVDDVTFRLGRGETLALVGESGCGKSTTARLVTRLLEPTAGAIRFEGSDVTNLSGGALLQFRRQVQFVFQDPFASLNPRMRVANILEEPLIVHGLGSKRKRTDRVHELLAKVGLPAELERRFPHEFSGGQRQRIGIARALAVGPSLIVCDEAVSALDVSIQAQIINLLADLQRELGLSYLFIAHDLAVVRHVSTRVAVMHRGRIVEVGAAKALFERPLHPYTRSLLAAIPVPDPDHVRTPVEAADSAPGEGGCTFRARCPYAIERCSKERPPLAGAPHQVACHRAAELPEFSPAMHPDFRSPGLRRRMALYRARSLPEPMLST